MRRLLLLLLCLPLFAQSTQRYRQWINGQELGGVEEQIASKDGVQTHTSKEWIELSRLGYNTRQDVEVRTTRSAEGALSFTWSLKLSQEPMVGEGRMDPRSPRLLHLQPKGGAARDLTIPEDAVLWPPDVEARLKTAALKGESLSITRFSAPTLEWSHLELRVQGPDALPGHPKALRLSGWERVGKTSVPVEFWVDPVSGLLKERSRLGALEVVVQRAELPVSGEMRSGEELFAHALKTLPPHAFLPWLTQLQLHQSSGAPLVVMEDAQCKALAPGKWTLKQAPSPTSDERADMPITGQPGKEIAPYLQPSPLLQFNDPLFDGLMHRLAPRPGATRWELAQQVTHFVFEWITEKDYSVGFASALEVVRTPKGDCTEHGVLAVALLRKLGVPARGAVGWVALDRTLGPHFWVEVLIKGRWIPIDPTFDQAPASAFRLKLGETDLADLGGVGWETAQVLGDSVLLPVWSAPVIEGDRLRAPDGLQLRWSGGQWMWVEGALTLRTPEKRVQLRAVTRPSSAQLGEAKLLQSPKGDLQGWWTSSRTFFLALPGARWMQVDGLQEAEAFAFLEHLRVEAPISK
jgi:hypothetical protein